MKHWTCFICGEPSDYDVCPYCEAAEIQRHEVAELQRKQYEEDLNRERYGQSGGD